MRKNSSTAPLIFCSDDLRSLAPLSEEPCPYNCADMNAIIRAISCVVLGTGSLAAQSEKVPVINGAAGPCSLELTVTAADGKPAYAATVKVHIEHGFGGFHKLDLEAGTNSDGKVKFTGLPARVRRPPLEFHALKDNLEGLTTYDPSAECQADHGITLQKSKV